METKRKMVMENLHVKLCVKGTTTWMHGLWSPCIWWSRSKLLDWWGLWTCIQKLLAGKSFHWHVWHVEPIPLNRWVACSREELAAYTWRAEAGERVVYLVLHLCPSADVYVCVVFFFSNKVCVDFNRTTQHYKSTTDSHVSALYVT